MTIITIYYAFSIVAACAAIACFLILFELNFE